MAAPKATNRLWVFARVRSPCRSFGLSWSVDKALSRLSHIALRSLEMDGMRCILEPYGDAGCTVLGNVSRTQLALRRDGTIGSSSNQSAYSALLDTTVLAIIGTLRLPFWQTLGLERSLVPGDGNFTRAEKLFNESCAAPPAATDAARPPAPPAPASPLQPSPVAERTSHAKPLASAPLGPRQRSPTTLSTESPNHMHAVREYAHMRAGCENVRTCAQAGAARERGGAPQPSHYRARQGVFAPRQPRSAIVKEGCAPPAAPATALVCIRGAISAEGAASPAFPCTRIA